MSNSWFTKYPDFEPNPGRGAPLLEEFKRLAEQRNWREGGKRYRKEWKSCVEANFTAEFGANASSLQSWQALCIEVGITDVPRSITGCKKALKGVWVNIVDLIDARRTGKPVERHESMLALRAYIKRTKKIYPKDAAKQNGFLKAFLITVFG